MPDLNFRRATEADVPAIIKMLADDKLGASREAFGAESLPTYLDAFRVVDRDPNQFLPRGSHDRALQQQSYRGFASADTPSGTADASIQIRPASPTVSLPSWCGPQSVPAGTSLTQI